MQGKVRKLRERDEVRLHLGCGANILPGWINIDTGEQFGSRSSLELVWNLADGLPFPRESVDCIYHEHFIEHLTRPQGLSLSKQCYEALKPGGVLRIACPGLELLVAGYLEKSFQEEEWVKDIATYLIGCSNCEVFNAGMREWGHQYMYDTEDLLIMLGEAGFSPDKIRVCDVGSSEISALAGLETRADSIVVEAVR